MSLNTDGLYITRKRKKWKFAHFDSYPNCFSHPRDKEAKDTLDSVKAYMPISKNLTLELAAGNAQFSLNLARKYPTQQFIAIDIKSDRLYTSAKQALEEKVENIVFIRMHINELPQLFKKNSIDTIWITFPDPYMRNRSKRRRLLHLEFLRQYRILLTSTGKLNFKTDNRDFFLWSLEQLVADKWNFHELSFDLHESELSDDYKIQTYYETKFIKLGFPINFTSLSAK